MIPSKILFNTIIRDLKLNESSDEMNALAFVVLNYFGVSRTDVITDKPVDFNFQKLIPIITRLNQHEPVQYILNEAWFCGRKFYVDPSVLIPRPETELVVEESIKLLNRVTTWQSPLRPVPSLAGGSGGSGLAILDIGTGSGCIAISLSLKFPGARVWGVDNSSEALRVAERNSRELKANVHFSQLNIQNEFPTGQQFDLIVSNPPYISNEEKSGLNENVLNYEPHLALFTPETDPLIFYRAIANLSKSVLKKSGSVVVEINERFGKEVCALFEGEGYSQTQIIRDLAGKDRVVTSRF